MGAELENFQKKKDFLFCVDSDGCAMDTMDIKHFRCFGPCMVEEWGLTEWEAILEQNRKLQKYAKIPVFIACNTEAGGDGACAAKHFPGNGQDFRDAHISNNVNYFGVEEWDATYGHVYRSLIENDLDAIMGGHILMPKYEKALDPSVQEDDMLPATLSKNIMTGLLRDKLGFKGWYYQ